MVAALGTAAGASGVAHRGPVPGTEPTLTPTHLLITHLHFEPAFPRHTHTDGAFDPERGGIMKHGVFLAEGMGIPLHPLLRVLHLWVASGRPP